MGVRRIMGSEVEYGISVQGQPRANPMVAATHVVNAYAAANGLARRARWDFEEENPLRDARGFDLSRDVADPTQLTDEDMGLANIILTNGARLYVDHAHPEYASPEVTTPLDIVRWEKAGERVMAAGARLAGSIPGASQIVLYKNNVDNKGAAYGSHENYLMRRDVPFESIVEKLTPFLVTRQIITGAGRVGRKQDGSVAEFQISQRADYIEVPVGLETTLKRPIINTRDEPHADAQLYRRLHVIVGDANCSQVAIYLKHGITSLVLAMIEADAVKPGFDLEAPVAELHRTSYDTSLRHRLTLTDGRTLTALELQSAYLQMATDFVARDGADEQTRDVLDRWESILERLERDPFECARELDWVAKLSLLEQYRERDNLSWGHPKLHLIDLQYHDIRPDKSLFQRLERTGRLQTLLDDADVVAAITDPPEDTRAYFRGSCLKHFASDIAAASWDSVIFDLPGYDSLQRVPTLDPHRGTKAHVGNLFQQCATAGDLFRVITGS